MEVFYSGIILFVILCGVVALSSLPVVGLIQNSDSKSQRYRKFAFWLSGFVLVIVVLGLCIFLVTVDKSSKIPEILFRAAAPLAAIGGFFMVYQNFKIAQEQIKIQREQNEKKEIRGHVKTRLDYHLKNVSDLEMSEKGEAPSKFGGRKAFKFFLVKYLESYERLEREWLYIMVYAIRKNWHMKGQSTAEIQSLFDVWSKTDSDEIWGFCQNHFAIIQEELEIHDNLKNRSCKQIFIVLVYLILFFSKDTFWEWLGVSFNREKLEKYRRNMTRPTIDWPDNPLEKFSTLEGAMGSMSGSTYTGIFEVKMKEEGQVEFINDASVESLDLQVYFGHYFRNLYNIYKYIDGIPFHDLKMECASLVKNQLSTYEQAVIFLNSLTNVGGVWELDVNKKGAKWEFFTKYHVIENIPKGMLRVIDPKKDVYPWLDFEYEEYS